MAKQSIWMTGAGGFIGREAVRACVGTGAEILCLTPAAVNPSAGPEADRPRRIQVDFLNSNDIRGVVQQHGLPDCFLHLGWGAMTDPMSSEHLGANVAASRQLIDTLYAAGLKKIVFVGTCNEYGAREGLLSEDQLPVGRLTCYAQAKAAVAAYGLVQARARARTFLAVRLFYVYGPSQRAGSLINKLYRCFRDGVAPELGPCEHYRDYLHVRDVAEGLCRLSATEETAVVNLGSGRAVRMKDFVIQFWHALGGSPERLRFGAQPMRAGEPDQPHSYADLETLLRLTGWTPGITLAEGIELTIRAMRGGAQA